MKEEYFLITLGVICLIAGAKYSTEYLIVVGFILMLCGSF